MITSGSLDQISQYVAQAQNPPQNTAVSGPPVSVTPATFPEDTITISSAAQNMVRALSANGESPDLIAAQLDLTTQSVADSLSLAATA
jgi:hypothetical protein